MKINLLRNSKALLSDYFNIDIVPGEGKLQGDVTNLDSLVDDSSCTDIVAHNILEYYEHATLGSILKHWSKKLAHNGTIKITTTDARSIARRLDQKRISITDMLSLVYGGQTGVLSYKRSMLTLDVLCSTLEANGLQIIERVSNSDELCVVAQRP